MHSSGMVKYFLHFFYGLCLLPCFLCMFRKKESFLMSPSQGVWVWLSCCWVPGRRKGWITAGCPFARTVLGTTDHSGSPSSGALSVGTAWQAGAAVTHRRRVSYSVAKESSMALLLFGVHNKWFRVAEPSGDAPIPLLHNWNTLPALLFNCIFRSQWYIWIHSPWSCFIDAQAP